MGHGHFFVPGYGEQFEVFSLLEAWQQLHSFEQARQVSMNQIAFLAAQIMNSGLPESRPPDIDELINTFCKTESWAACYDHAGEERPKSIQIDSAEIAEAVHEYRIGLPEMRLQ
jgi:hypothetical protein